LHNVNEVTFKKCVVSYDTASCWIYHDIEHTKFI